MAKLKLEVFGPLLFWSLLFTVGIAIKWIAFHNISIWFDIAPEASLWATGILFTLAVSEKTYFQIRTVPRYTKNPSGTGYSVEYKVTIPDEVGFTPKFIYLFFIGMAFWILNLILCGHAANKYQEAMTITTNVIISYLIAVFLAVVLVVIALFALYEVLK